MARRKRTKGERERDLAVEADLYCRGWSMAQIAEQIGVTAPQVHYDLQEVRARWLASSVRNFDQAKAEELAKIDAVERQAWRAWEASQAPEVTTTAKRGPAGATRSRRKISRTGDRGFLLVVLECIDRRCEILRIAERVPAGLSDDRRNPYARLSEQERLDRLVAMFDAVREGTPRGTARGATAGAGAGESGEGGPPPTTH